MHSQLNIFYMPTHHYATKYGVHLDSRILKMTDHFKHLEKEIEMKKLTIDGIKSTSLEAAKGFEGKEILCVNTLKITPSSRAAHE